MTVPRYASIPPASARVLNGLAGRQFAKVINDQARVLGDDHWLVRELRHSLDQLRASAKWWDDDSGRPAAAPPDGPVLREIDVPAAAEFLHLSEPYVRRLAEAGVEIWGRRADGRRWLLDEKSVIEFAKRRAAAKAS